MTILNHQMKVNSADSFKDEIGDEEISAEEPKIINLMEALRKTVAEAQIAAEAEAAETEVGNAVAVAAAASKKKPKAVTGKEAGAEDQDQVRQRHQLYGGPHAQTQGGLSRRLPAVIAPLLAKLGPAVDSDQPLFEIKWDGKRVLVYVEADSGRILARNGNAVTGHYSELTSLNRLLARTVVD